MDLFGFEPPPPRLKRSPAPRLGSCSLFFALLPDAEARRKMLALGAELKSRHRLAGKLQPEQRLHLTLDHLGDFGSVPHDIVKVAGDAASALAAGCAGFAVGLDRIVSFGRGDSSRPVVLRDSGAGPPGLREFRDRLWDALAACGVAGGPRSAFSPHVSLLYDQQVLAEEPVDPIRWQAQQWVLLYSVPKQPHYEVLGRWAFRS
ncbi:MAG: 2'-5' RNA ligase family protein [Polaromonas sp.]|uniref:2'-5' RNA ligase family protein n=1 Tax=Polaromonas sp. TaxID=1869339 RepID=UPI004037546C